MRQHSVLAALCGGAVGGGTVQIYRTGSSLVGGQTAGQQRRKHPSQYIPAAAPGKPPGCRWGSSKKVWKQILYVNLRMQ